MAKRQNTKEVLYEFMKAMEKEIVLSKTQNATIQDIVKYLCEVGLVEPKRLRNYLIIHQFDHLLKENEGNITHTFCDLAIKFEMSESQVGRVVYKERKKNQPHYNLRIQ
tara:strand:+ start:30 stop:356 length:327 start_codon:yes stop_codon:yes gene_type:complete